MCGICGTVSFTGEGLEEDVAERMTAALAHRGPDGHGIAGGERFRLGCRRLAVIDPSPRGDQPMTLEDLTLVFNGELYDHVEERRRLEAAGHRFRTRTDTEVLLHLYRERGVECVERLRGMFAFALWDEAERRLLLARDRFGEKPLYHHAGPGCFVFASELKALLRHPSVRRDLDPAALHDFLSFDYVPGPGTVFAAIEQLPPGHLMLVDRDGVRTRRWWQPSYRPRAAPPPTVDEAAAGVRDRLRESLSRRRVADVPVGVLLSGGIDSSAMVALLREAGDDPIRTFTLGFVEEDRDERAHAQAVADAFGTEHHDYAFGPDRAAALLPEVVAHFDQPLSDPSVLPTWELARHVREHVTVTLAGEGGDETFAGYRRYVKNQLAAVWYRVPAPLRASSAHVFDALFQNGRPDSLTTRLQGFFAGGRLPPDDLFCRWLLHFDHDLKRRVYTDDFWAATGGRDSCERIRELYRASDAADGVNALLDVDVRSYLADDLLVKLDVATMRHGLEARSPYLDHDLHGFVASLPGDRKLRRFQTKWILRRALRDRLPADVMKRPKAGFGPPVQRWLRGPLRELATDVLTDDRARQRGCFRPEAVRALLDEHVAGRRNHGYQLWNLLVFELWHRQVADGA